MIDFVNQIKKAMDTKPTDPCEIYDNLDRTGAAGALRDAQQEVLKEWYLNRYNDRNIVIKLHTGEGKTLIGLLMLLSKLNDNQGPALYVCPNINLCNQVINDAKKFGIPHCTLMKDQKEIPVEFINNEKILITYVQKVFNGKTIFGIGQRSEMVGTVVIDDAHACIESIREAYTVNIDRSKHKEIYNALANLFDEPLRAQGEGSYLDVIDQKTSDVIQIPYWAWIDRQHEVTEILGRDRDAGCLLFQWPLLRDHLDCCTAYVSASGIEIIPFHFDVEQFKSYSCAKQRILMSATTQEDSFFVKGLNFDLNAIRTPITASSKKWSGEKMVLIPSLIDDSLTPGVIRQQFLSLNQRKTMGRFIIVPSYRYADEYEKECGCKVLNNDLLQKISTEILQGEIHHANVIVNRYDGIDLPDDVCRMLVIDSLPFCEKLSDNYERTVREDSEIVNRRIAQKIEQGMGRSVRSEKDYSAIILIGSDLVRFVRSNNTAKYFSDQTRKQIEIGMQIASLAMKDSSCTKPMKALTDVMEQFYGRDPGWKEFYRQNMDSIEVTQTDKTTLYELVELEHKVEEAYFNHNLDKALKNIDKILGLPLTKNEKAWYMQIKARILYSKSKVDSVSVQTEAFNLNHHLLKPYEGLMYHKLKLKDSSQIDGVKSWLAQFSDFEQLNVEVNDLLSDLSFGVAAKTFEKAVYKLGLLLGFGSQRPDDEIGKGPDNLWSSPRMYFLIEDKSEVNMTRQFIDKHETGQMNSHCAWFEDEYHEAEVFRIWIHPTQKLSKESNLGYEVHVLRKKELNKLKNQIRSFIREFRNYDLQSLSTELIHQALTVNKLTTQNLTTEYAVCAKKYEDG